MTSPRLDTFRQMVARDPANPLARFGLANEALKAGLYEEAREALRRGIAASHRFGHPSMAADFEARLEELDDA